MDREQYVNNRFDLYGALYLFCNRYHSGQWSRGYRILSRLSIARYRPGLSIQQNRFETEEQKEIYKILVRNYKNKM
jgi:hypothetical protein